LASAPSVRLAIALAAAQEPLTQPPGTRSVYSDLGFIVLGWLLERVVGARLDAQADSGIFQPLGLSASSFVNLADPDARTRLLAEHGVAATQHCPIRGRVLVGEVDDMNAHAMAGVAGHAGLFSTADDLSRIAGALVSAWRGSANAAESETFPSDQPAGSGAGGGPQVRAPMGAPAPARALIDGDVVRTFWRPAGVPGSTWRRGWDGPSPAASQAGDRLPKSAVGHLGFTGCSLWIDPERARWIITLTNRVHPVVRDDDRFRAFRPAIQDAAVDALESAASANAADTDNRDTGAGTGARTGAGS
jgi:CubicO group peptidase (beta-lactamase class C family)